MGGRKNFIRGGHDKIKFQKKKKFILCEHCSSKIILKLNSVTLRRSEKLSPEEMKRPVLPGEADRSFRLLRIDYRFGKSIKMQQWPYRNRCLDSMVNNTGRLLCAR